MISKKNIMIVIPARGGSKGIKNKNLLPYLGKPLILHSVDQSIDLLESGLINKIVLTTDSDDIAKTVREYDSRVWIPFMRPDEISQDLSTDLEFFEHLIDYLENNYPQDLPDILVHLRPTYPYRSVKEIRKALETYIPIHDKYDCLRSVFKWEGKSPLKMFVLDQPNSNLIPLKYEINGIKEPYNMPRQLLPDIYSCNGYLDIINRLTITQKKSVSGTTIYPWIMDSDKIDDLDTLDDWHRSEEKQSKQLNNF
uniref:Cytidylyltransferase n=1 Tax=viral metagenome TaxID=1070528 RepID=A0A6C0E6C3_9ZZZZ